MCVRSDTEGRKKLPCKIALLRCINDGVVINSKEVRRTDSTLLVPLFSLVSHLLTNDLSDVLIAKSEIHVDLKVERGAK